MKYGIKLWSSDHNKYYMAIEAIKNKKADYLELTYIPSKTEKLELLKKSKLPMIIHSINYSQGISYSDDNFKKNLNLLKKNLKMADFLEAKYVIIHPDVGSVNNLIRLLNAIRDKRIIIENMPKKGLVSSSNLLCHTPEEIKKVVDSCNVGFCFDIAHCIKSAISQGIDYKRYVQEFIKLKPRMYHISNGTFEKEEDEHIDLWAGEYDVGFIKATLKRQKKVFITFEVPKGEGLKNDIKNIDYFKKLS